MFLFFKRIQLKNKSDELYKLVADLDLELFGEKGKVNKIFDKLCIQNKFRLFVYSASSHYIQPVMSQFFEENIINRALSEEIDLDLNMFQFIFEQYFENKFNSQEKIDNLSKVIDKCNESIENRNFWLRKNKVSKMLIFQYSKNLDLT